MENDFSENIILSSELSKDIYQQFCQRLPIYDYHCHLKAEDIYTDKTFRNITELWLSKDHYKWRLMRANGIDEFYITGNASDKEKFFAWAKTIERSIGNPMYHWVHMELKSVFNIEKLLTEETASYIWDKTNELLGANGITCRDLINQFSVKLIGTTDQPLSLLTYHQLLMEETTEFKVIPTLRVDSLINLNGTFINKVIERFNQPILTLADYLDALDKIFDYFDYHGCQSVDLGLGKIYFQSIQTEVELTFLKLLDKKNLNQLELMDLQTYLTLEIARRTYHKNWVFQMHFGAIGSINQQAKQTLGVGTGFDTIVEQDDITSPLMFWFNELNSQNKLPKVILYNIDGTKNNSVQTVMACFQGNKQGIRGKIQHGPAWWFQDTLLGNKRQLESLAEQGILMNFVGMTTDSRSYLSYVRHDYFRRILCNLLADWIRNKEIPNDRHLIAKFIEDICYKNTIYYFNLDGEND